eukprot:1281995-Amphidinium_carterae.1
MNSMRLPRRCTTRELLHPCKFGAGVMLYQEQLLSIWFRHSINMGIDITVSLAERENLKSVKNYRVIAFVSRWREAIVLMDA